MREDWTATLMRMAKPALLVAGILLTMGAAAADKETHGLSAFGELKYPPDFKHFEWVNPDAPKGGRLSTIGTVARTSFDSFNNYILKGDAAQGLPYLFDSLMARALDEPDAVYGLVAHSAQMASDRSWVIFRLRPEAKFADGSALTAEDVVFTLNVLKEKGHPIYRVQLKDVSKVEALDPHTVRYTFTGTQTRDLPLVVAGLPVFSKAYYTTHDFDQTSLEPPLGSGPYKIDGFRPGAYVSYKRRDDYWAKDLPVNRGRFNFDELRFEYYRDRTAELESLKAGAFDLREEFTSRDWVTGYDIAAVREGRLIKLTLPDENPSGAQGFFLNTRRPKLADVRVRKALDYAFDYEWTNKNLFSGLYTRTESFFENSDMKASGKPESGRAGPARAVPHAIAPGGVRGALQAAGVGRHGARPQAAARGRPAARRGRLDGQGRQACRCQGRDARARVPDRRSDLRAHHHALRQEPAGARYRRQHPPHRSRPV